MNCETCINKTSPYKKGCCRTMISPFPDYSCHMDKETAISVEYKVMAHSNDKSSVKEARSHIKWLKGLEG